MNNKDGCYSQICPHRCDIQGILYHLLLHSFQELIQFSFQNILSSLEEAIEAAIESQWKWSSGFTQLISSVFWKVSTALPPKLLCSSLHTHQSMMDFILFSL